MGAKNVISGTARENIQAVFVRLGGTAAMERWARKKQNEDAFYERVYPRLVSQQVDATVKVSKIVHETKVLK